MEIDSQAALQLVSWINIDDFRNFWRSKESLRAEKKALCSITWTIPRPILDGGFSRNGSPPHSMISTPLMSASIPWKTSWNTQICLQLSKIISNRYAPPHRLCIYSYPTSRETVALYINYPWKPTIHYSLLTSWTMTNWGTFLTCWNRSNPLTNCWQYSIKIRGLLSRRG